MSFKSIYKEEYKFLKENSNEIFYYISDSSEKFISGGELAALYEAGDFISRNLFKEILSGIHKYNVQNGLTVSGIPQAMKRHIARDIITKSEIETIRNQKFAPVGTYEKIFSYFDALREKI